MNNMKFEQILMARNTISRLTLQISELQNAIEKQQTQNLIFMEYEEDSMIGSKVSQTLADSNSIIADLTEQIAATQRNIARQNEIIDMIIASGDFENPANKPPEELEDNPEEDPDGSTDNP